MKYIKRIFLSLLITVTIIITGVKADGIFNLENFKLLKNSDGAKISNIKINGDTISENTIFKHTGDNASYEITIKNNTDSSYYIKNIYSETKLDNIKYSFDYKKEKILPNKIYKFILNEEYVKNIDTLKFNSEIKTKIIIETDKQKISFNLTNPKTTDNISLFVVLAILSITILCLILTKNKKHNKLFLLLLLLLLPIITYAYAISIHNLNNNIVLYNDDYKKLIKPDLDYNKDWINEDAIIKASVTNDVDLDHYEYSTDGGKTWDKVIDDTVTRSDEGEKETLVRTVDEDGEASDASVATTKIDKTKPIISHKETKETTVNHNGIINLKITDMTIDDYDLDIDDFTTTPNIEIKNITKKDDKSFDIEVDGKEVGIGNISLKNNILKDDANNYNDKYDITINIKGDTYTATFKNGEGVNKITPESETCTTTGSNSSCEIDIPNITLEIGYNNPKMYDEDGNEILKIDKDCEITIKAEREEYTLIINVDNNKYKEVKGNYKDETTLDVPEKNYTIKLNPNNGEKIDDIKSNRENTGIISDKQGKLDSTKYVFTNSSDVVNINYSDKGKEVKLPVPEKDGYTFTGWYDNNIKVDNNYVPTKDTILEAKWNINTYKITYDLDDGVATNPETYTIETDTFKLNNPTKTGYTFTGWTGSNGETPSKEVSIEKGSTGDKTYNANYTANNYKINYDLKNGVKGASAPTSANYDANVNISNPTKTITITINSNNQDATVSNSAVSKAQTFAGWTFDGNTATAKYGTSTDNITNSWTNKNAKVTATYFKNLTDKNGETVTMSANWNPVAIELPTVTKTGNDCNYNTSANGSGTNYNSGSNYTPTDTQGNDELYVICKPKQYTITRQYRLENADGTFGSYTQIDSKKYNYGSSVAAWNRNADDTYQAATIPAYTVGAKDDVLSVNVMRKTSTNNKIQYRLQNTDGTYPTTYTSAWSGTLRYGESHTWNRNADTTHLAATGTVSYNQGTVNVDVKRKSGKFIIKANGGSSDITTSAIYYGQSNNKLSSMPSRTGYTLNGLYTSQTGGTKVVNANGTPANDGTYSNNNTWLLTQDVTVYAQWTINNYTATFNGNGGTNGASITKTYGSELGTLPSSSREGYIFDGWFTAASGGTQISSSTTMPGSNTTYYAHWTSFVAKNTIDGTTTYYNSLQDALDVIPSGATGTTTLLVDRTEAIVIGRKTNKKWTLDLGGHTLTTGRISVATDDPSSTVYMPVVIENGIINDDPTYRDGFSYNYGPGANGDSLISSWYADITLSSNLTINTHNSRAVDKTSVIHLVNRTKVTSYANINSSYDVLVDSDGHSYSSTRSISTFNLNGGTLTSTNTGNGFVIYNDGATFNATGGTIINNSNSDPTIYNVGGGIMNLGSGLTINGNSPTYVNDATHGAVYNYSGIITSNANINSSNISAVINEGTFNFKGGKIETTTNNHTIQNKNAFKMTGGTISSTANNSQTALYNIINGLVNATGGTISSKGYGFVNRSTNSSQQTLSHMQIDANSTAIEQSDGYTNGGTLSTYNKINLNGGTGLAYRGSDTDKKVNFISIMDDTYSNKQIAKGYLYRFTKSGSSYEVQAHNNSAITQMPTWSIANGQDDLKNPWPTPTIYNSNGNYYKFYRFNKSDYKDSSANAAYETDFYEGSNKIFEFPYNIP